MQVSNEVLLTILGSLCFVAGWLISYFVGKIKEKNPKTLDTLSFILQLIENFIKANPELVEKSWKSFYDKIKSWIEKNIKIDLTEEQWEIINEKLLELYDRLKLELKQE